MRSSLVCDGWVPGGRPAAELSRGQRRVMEQTAIPALTRFEMSASRLAAAQGKTLGCVP